MKPNHKTILTTEQQRRWCAKHTITLRVNRRDTTEAIYNGEYCSFFTGSEIDGFGWMSSLPSLIMHLWPSELSQLCERRCKTVTHRYGNDRLEIGHAEVIRKCKELPLFRASNYFHPYEDETYPGVYNWVGFPFTDNDPEKKVMSVMHLIGFSLMSITSTDTPYREFKVIPVPRWMVKDGFAPDEDFILRHGRGE